VIVPGEVVTPLRFQVEPGSLESIGLLLYSFSNHLPEQFRDSKTQVTGGELRRVDKPVPGESKIEKRSVQSDENRTRKSG
jgi:hypothetical protein